MDKGLFEEMLKAYIKDNYDFLVKRDKQNKRAPYMNKFEGFINAYDDCYLLRKEYASIRGLYFFWKDNRDLTSKQVEDIIRHYNKTFKFLNKALDLLPDMLEDLKVKGPRVVAGRYKSAKVMEMSKEAKNKN